MSHKSCTNLKVSKVEIENFKGVTDRLILDFSTLQRKPVSTIIAGDNGAGKSSIVAALEFALQSRGGVPGFTSYFGEGLPQVKVLLSDESVATRTFDATKNPRRSCFALSPFVLRRADILRFWSTPEPQRQLMFRDYFRDAPQTKNWDTDTKQKLQELNQTRLALKEERRDSARRLAQRLKIAPEHVPLSEYELNEFVTEKIYKGMRAKKRAQLQRRGMAPKFDTTAIELANAVRKYAQDIKQVEQDIKVLRKGDVSYEEVVKKNIEESMSRIGEQLTDSFLKISTTRSYVDQIRLLPGKVSEVSLSLEVVLKNGKVVKPTEIFSEANLDLLAFLIFLAVAKESALRGQSKLLVLDDVLQSVDASIRLQIAEYILEEFFDWQLIFTVHDRLWQEQLRILFQRSNIQFVEREIVRWDPEQGPVIIGGSRDMEALLQEALNYGDLYRICSESGLLLERACNVLSYTLPISVTRRREDKYTLGDLWPGVLKVLKKTTIAEVAADVERWLHLRNLVGAHYNEWAASLSRQDAQLFGTAVLKLLAHVKCESCHRWIEEAHSKGADKVWQCRCGSARVEKAQGK